MVHTLYHHGDEVPAVDLGGAQLRAAAADPAGVLWVDVEDPPTAELAELLVNALKFEPLIVDAWRGGTPLPGPSASASCLFVSAVLPTERDVGGTGEAGPASDGGEPETVLGLFLRSTCLLTVHNHPIATIAAMRADMAASVGLLAEGADRIAAQLMLHSANWKLQRLSVIEDSLAARGSALPQLTQRAGQAASIGRSARAEAAALDLLANQPHDAIQPVNRVYFRAGHQAALAAQDRAEALGEWSARLVSEAVPAAIARVERTLRWFAILVVLLAVLVLLALATCFTGRIPEF